MSDPFYKDWNSIENPPVVSAYADITVVIDRSASMIALQQGVVDGFNAHVKRMRETPGDSKWTMVHFDDHNSARGADETFPNVLFESKSEKEVPFLTLAPSHLRSEVEQRTALSWNIHPSKEEPCPVASGEPTCLFQPRGGTALVDAVCKSIQQAEIRTSGQEARVKPIMMIITDGQENSSYEHSSAQMREMIARFTKKGAEFLYLGANQDAFAEAQKYNMASSLTAAGFAPVASGGVDVRNCQNAFNYTPTSAGMMEGIASGMIGVCATVSGSVNPNVVMG